MLVYYGQTDNVHSAIKREKDLKLWKREWTMRIIEEMNSEWKDLYYELSGVDDTGSLPSQG